MDKKVFFHLSRRLRILGKDFDPYESIRCGRKTVEYRSNSRFWRLHLIQAKPTKAWFVVGYPKDNLPRLEADITRIVRRHSTNQIEVHFEHVVEITK